MSKEYINLDEIAKSISQKIGLSYPQCQKIIRQINETIGDDLKSKGKVRLHEFGLFYLSLRKSRSIYQIRTKQKRLLLEQMLIRFKSSPVFKSQLMGQTATVHRPERKNPQISEKVAIQIKQNNKPTGKDEGVEVNVSPKSSDRIKFPPYSLMRPVDPESVRQKILDRILKIKPVENIKKKLAISLPTKLDLTASSQGKTFYSLFKQVRLSQQRNIAFTISSEKVVSLYSGRPRKKIAGLPKEIVEKFLAEYLEINGFDIPQERFAKIDVDGVCFIKAYSIPTSEGASFYLKIDAVASSRT
jgi:nucleoid DNA-binding protein